MAPCRATHERDSCAPKDKGTNQAQAPVARRAAERDGRMRARLLILLAALALTAAAPAVAGGAEIGTSPVYSIGPGHVFVDWVPGASSTLVRTANGIDISLQT